MKTNTFSSISCDDNNSIVSDVLDGVQFDAFFSKKESKKLVIMFPGSIDRSKISPPVYQRWSWHNEICANILSVNDPTLFLAEHLRIGWLLGTKDKDYTALFCEFLNKCLRFIFPDVDELLFYGSSAGGFMAMQVASRYEGCKVLVNNCQTDVLKYRKKHVNDMLGVSFSGMSILDIQETYGERVSLIKRYASSPMPRVIYMQNIADDFHMKNHFLPFINSFNNVSLGENTSLTIQLYRDDKTGHGPLSKDLSLAQLHELLSE
ncbi:hypothetical protein [Aeromonas rivipollensis]|uniref:hypothetical protein n=1 Tax=Aeromonas rivipollensis TaxID=948519 RepID=UPI003D192741